MTHQVQQHDLYHAYQQDFMDVLYLNSSLITPLLNQTTKQGLDSMPIKRDEKKVHTLSHTKHIACHYWYE